MALSNRAATTTGTGPPWSRSSLALSLRRYVPRRKRRTFAKEVVFHLLQKEFLRFLRPQVEAVFVHDHFHVLQPELPRLFGNVVVDALTERMTFEGNLVQTGHFPLELDAKYLAAAGVLFNPRPHHPTATTHARSPST